MVSQSTKAGIIDCVRNKHFFTKYPELKSGKDNNTYAFVENNYSDQTIVAETMRFAAAVLSIGAGFLMPLQAPPIQLDYLRSIFKLEFSGKLLLYDNSDPGAYLNVIHALPSSSLFVLYPYGAINPSQYVVAPETLFALNNKALLHKISGNIPARQVFSLDELCGLCSGSGAWSPPFVIKKDTGSSGDGVLIVHDLSMIDGFVKEKACYLVEQYISAKANFGIQFFINSDSSIHYVGYSEQDTSSKGEFEGVLCHLKDMPNKDLLSIGFSAAKSVANHGYVGFVGFDVLHGNDGEYYIIDANVRLTAASPAYILADYIIPVLGRYVYLGSGEIRAKSSKEVIGKLESAGAVLLSMSHQSGISTYKFFAMVGGTDRVSAKDSWLSFRKQLSVDPGL
ncbi:ATP-grasp domain-containing protein [Candidatus Woesearchaeota archaeon]|nr:ATP-grasp domain-containing protein [Candidatus Woesearchaeota archaeon]